MGRGSASCRGLRGRDGVAEGGEPLRVVAVRRWTLRWSKVLVLGDEQVATSSSSSSSFDGLPRVCLAWQTAPTGCAVGFVREYYADLKRNDGTAPAKKWNSIGTHQI